MHGGRVGYGACVISKKMSAGSSSRQSCHSCILRCSYVESTYIHVVLIILSCDCWPLLECVLYLRGGSWSFVCPTGASLCCPAGLIKGIIFTVFACFASMTQEKVKAVLSLSNCILPEERLRNTPSSADGLSVEDEVDVRIVGCNFIQSAGILLKLPQVCKGKEVFFFFVLTIWTILLFAPGRDGYGSDFISAVFLQQVPGETFVRGKLLSLLLTGRHDSVVFCA